MFIFRAFLPLPGFLLHFYLKGIGNKIELCFSRKNALNSRIIPFTKCLYYVYKCLYHIYKMHDVTSGINFLTVQRTLKTSHFVCTRLVNGTIGRELNYFIYFNIQDVLKGSSFQISVLIHATYCKHY